MNRSTRFAAAAALILSGLAPISCARKGPEGIAPWLSAPIAVSPAGQSAESPWLSLGPDAKVRVSWTARSEVWLATSADAGKTFGTPVRVNDASSEFTGFVEDPPKIALGPEGNVYVAWAGKVPGLDRMSAIFVARSTDGGSTFAAPVRVSDDSGERFHLCESLATETGGTLHVAWIDGRGVAREGSDALMLYTSVSRDGGATFAPNEPAVRKDVCPCCRTALLIGPEGRPVLAYRHVYPEDYRDITVARAGAAGDTAPWPTTRVSNDAWQIVGCPDSGPSVTLDPGGTIHIAWFTAADPAGIRYATSPDGGATFRSMGRVQPADAGNDSAHPVIAVAKDGAVWVAWDQGGPSADGKPATHRQVRMAGRRVGAQAFGAPIPVAFGAWHAYAPVLATDATGALSFVWVKEEGQSSRIVFTKGKPPRP